MSNNLYAVIFVRFQSGLAVDLFNRLHCNECNCNWSAFGCYYIGFDVLKLQVLEVSTRWKTVVIHPIVFLNIYAMRTFTLINCKRFMLALFEINKILLIVVQKQKNRLRIDADHSTSKNNLITIRKRSHRRAIHFMFALKAGANRLEAGAKK